MKNVRWEYIASAAAFLGAAWVATTGHDGWGWLIVAGILVAGT